MTRFIAAAAFASCLAFSSPWPVVVALSVVALATDMGTPGIWAFCMDIGGQHVGSVFGWSNMCGNLGAMVASKYLHTIKENVGPDIMFLSCAAAMLGATVCALFLNANKPIVPAERLAA